MSYTVDDIKKAGNTLFWFAQILEEYAEDKDKELTFNDRVFSANWALECHDIHSKIEYWIEQGLIQEIIEETKKIGHEKEKVREE